MSVVTVGIVKKHIESLVGHLEEIGEGKKNYHLITFTDGQKVGLYYHPVGSDERVNDVPMVEIQLTIARGWGDYVSAWVEWDDDIEALRERLRISGFMGITSNFTSGDRLGQLLTPGTEIITDPRSGEIMIRTEDRIIFNTSITFPHKAEMAVMNFCNEQLYQAVSFKIAYTELLDEMPIGK